MEASAARRRACCAPSPPLLPALQSVLFGGQEPGGGDDDTDDVNPLVLVLALARLRCSRTVENAPRTFSESPAPTPGTREEASKTARTSLMNSWSWDGIGRGGEGEGGEGEDNIHGVRVYLYVCV